MNHCWVSVPPALKHTDCFTHRVDGVDKLAGLAELHEALPEVVEGSLNKDFLLLVVVQQVVPKRLLGKGLGVPHDDHTIPSFIRQDFGDWGFFQNFNIFTAVFVEEGHFSGLMNNTIHMFFS